MMDATEMVQALGTLLLAVLAWTGNRMVRQMDTLAGTVQKHGEYFAGLDARMGHVDDRLERIEEALR